MSYDHRLCRFNQTLEVRLAELVDGTAVVCICPRVMEYIDRDHIITLFTHFKTNTKSIGRHLQSVKMLCAYKKIKI